MILKALIRPEENTFTYFSKASTCMVGNYAPDVITLQFKTAKTGSLFFKKFKESLPLIKTEFPKFDQANVHITKEQYLFFRRQVMYESGNLTMDYLKDCLLKTLRADEFDFSYQFIQGIIPGDNNSRRLHNLRPTQRKSFIISPDGTIKAREYKKPMYTKEQKVGFSQAQSNTLLDPEALSQAFGFSRGHRNDKLYGIVTHKDDSLFNRLLTDDSGTISRIFDFDTNELAENGLNSLKTTFYTVDQLEEFKVANKQARKINSRTNEVLARIRFNPYRTVVCICSDTLEARLLAYHFAQELLEEYKLYAEKHGIIVNLNFRIPIVFYIRKDKVSGLFTRAHHEIRSYTDTMRKKDEAEAARIYSNNYEKQYNYRYNNFEFLLGLQNISKEILLDMCLGQPLAYVMMKNGYTRMLMRLLKTTELRKKVFNSLVSKHPGLFRQNDPIIGALVLTEQFDLADILIQATHTNKMHIETFDSNYTDLRSYLLRHGNPRQIEYMGLDEMLLQAAKNNEWVTIRLCLKELPNIQNSTILSLFSKAGQYKKTCEEKFMFKRRAAIDFMINELFTSTFQSKYWEAVESLLSNPLIYENKALLGSALIEAINDKQIPIAQLLIKAGARPEKPAGRSHLIKGVLYYTLTNRLFKLIPEALKVEEGHPDDDAPIRLHVALHLAKEIMDPLDLGDLETTIKKRGPLSPNRIKFVIGYLFLTALANDNPQLAEKRLLALCHHYGLLPQDNNSINDALNIIMDHFHEVVKEILMFDHFKIYSYIVKHYLDEKDVDQLLYLLTPPNDPNFKNLLRKTLFHSLLQNLSNDNFEVIKSIKRQFIDTEHDPIQKEYKLSNWYSKLNDFFYTNIHSDELTEDKILSLFRLGLEFFGDRSDRILELLLKRSYFKAAEKIVTNPKIKEEDLFHCVIVITRYPNSISSLAASIENKALLGRALLWAIANKNIPATQSLMRAGALPEKTNFDRLFIEGVLYHTLMNRLFDLVPDAIDVEKKYNDEDAQLRYHVALLLSYELGDPSSIHHLENLSDKFKNADLRTIKFAIFYSFLKALSRGNVKLAEEQLMSNCQRYKLLSNDNTISDALDIIIELYYDVHKSISLYVPEHFSTYIVKHCLNEKNIHKLIYFLTNPKGLCTAYYYCMHGNHYRILLSLLTRDNIETVKLFIHEYVNNKDNNLYEFDIVSTWQTAIKKSLEHALSSKENSEEKILLLFDIEYTPLFEDEWIIAFESLLEHQYFKAAAKIIDHPKIPKTALARCALILRNKPESAEQLATSLSNISERLLDENTDSNLPELPVYYLR